MTSSAILGLGSNLGDREGWLDKAIDLIRGNVGSVDIFSSRYETEPWGFQSINSFLNMVVIVQTKLDPENLMRQILNIELVLGRKRDHNNYVSRTIDIDILLYDDKVIRESGLKIPHPLIQERRFVLVPLCEIAPEMIHPVLMKTFRDLLNECKDDSKVIKFSRPGMRV